MIRGVHTMFRHSSQMLEKRLLPPDRGVKSIA